MAEHMSYQGAARAAGAVPHVRTADGRLDIALATPPELGGTGKDGSDAEQLLAAGYAACFLSALQYAAARRSKVLPPSVSVSARVKVAQDESARFHAQIEVETAAPSLPSAEFSELVDAAKELWPYSQSPAISVGISRSDGADQVQEARAQASEGRGYGG